MKKKRTRRDNVKYPALDPSVNLKTRFENFDQDYIHKLNDKEKQWLNNFNTEFVNADFTTNKKRVHRKRKAEHEKNQYLRQILDEFLLKIKEFIKILNESQVTSKSKSKIKKSINKFKKQFRKQIKDEFNYVKDFYKRESEHRNNARNSCVLTAAKAQGMAKSLDLLPETLIKKETEIDYKMEIMKMVLDFFNGDKAKTSLWFKTKNPSLGNFTPVETIEFGNELKLYNWVKEQIDSNKPVEGEE